MLHNDKPSTDRLDKLARTVLVEAIKFERAKHEAVKYGNTEADANTLCAAVAAYREAMVAELVGTEPTLGG